MTCGVGSQGWERKVPFSSGNDHIEQSAENDAIITFHDFDVRMWPFFALARFGVSDGCLGC